MDNWGWTKSNSDHSYIYRIPIRPGGSICEHLGIVKARADGRWNWWRKKSQFHKWGTGQGVAATKHEAVLKVEEGWTPPVPVDYDPEQPMKCSLCGHSMIDFPTKSVRLRGVHGGVMVGKASGGHSITVEVHEACIWAQYYEKYVC